MRFSETETQMLTRCVRELRARTSAEVVLVVRKVSGNYRDIDYLFGGFVALIALCVMLYSPWDFHELSVPFPILLVFFTAAFACRRTGLRRYLTRGRRRESQARRSAEACFFEKGVGGTRDRSGILIYLSMMEKIGVILPDPAVAPRLDAARLGEFARVLGSVAAGDSRRRAEHLGGFLRSFGVYLGHRIPAGGAGVTGSDLDNRPELDSEEDE